jgi:hypothetical protein
MSVGGLSALIAVSQLKAGGANADAPAADQQSHLPPPRNVGMIRLTSPADGRLFP